MKMKSVIHKAMRILGRYIILNAYMTVDDRRPQLHHLSNDDLKALARGQAPLALGDQALFR